MIGQRFNRLTVTGVVSGRGMRATVAVQCACGTETTALANNVKRGRTKSCGCLRRESSARTSAMNTKHGHAGRRSREYMSWSAMLSRCTNPMAPKFSEYGGCGITVCERWRDSFAAFLADMGPRPADTSIDRIDGRRGYEPGNCRWATAVEQRRNRVR